MAQDPIIPEVRVDQPQQQAYHWSLTIVGLAFAMGLIYYGEMVLSILCFSILVTFVLAPLVEGLQRLRLPRGLASFFAVLLFVGVLYGVVYFSYNQAEVFADNLPKYSQKIGSLLKPIRTQAERIEKTTEAVQGTDAKNVVLVRPATTWADTLTRGFGSITQELFAISFIPFLSYFFLTWHYHARSATVMLFPLEYRHTAFVTLGQIATMLRSFILGNVLLGLFMSGISVAVFGYFHLPFFYFIGFISGFLNLVPYLGVMAAMALPIFVGLGHLEPQDLVFLALIVLGIHVFALNVLYPKVLGARLKLNPLAVTIALLFWGVMWGAVGLLLAIPITAAMKIVFDHVESLKPYAEWLGE